MHPHSDRDVETLQPYKMMRVGVLDGRP